jgi:hypothetical protein
MKMRGWFYWWARFLGDVHAIEKGPAAMIKRGERKLLGRLFGRLMRKLVP